MSPPKTKSNKMLRQCESRNCLVVVAMLNLVCIICVSSLTESTEVDPVLSVQLLTFYQLNDKFKARKKYVEVQLARGYPFVYSDVLETYGVVPNGESV